MISNTLIDELKDIVGPRGFRAGEEIEPRHFEDLMGSRAERPLLLLRPVSTLEVSRILKACHEVGQPVSPQGGMTGLVSAAAPYQQEIAVSLERMNQIAEIDAYTGTMTVEAGVTLQAIQQQAAAQGLLFPLDLGARGSCTIGGNLSTNAGGNRVIRYGMTRELVLGVEAVLADGTVISSLNKLRKNNTGYDLKQLFIGSEGTLGIITRAVLRLLPQPTTQSLALCALKDFDAVTSLLLHAQKTLAGNLTAFEVLWQNSYSLIHQHIRDIKLPLPVDHAFYVLIEAMGSSSGRDKEQFIDTLDAAMTSGFIDDVVVAESEKQIQGLWRIRDAAAEVSSGVGYMHTYDVSLTVGNMGYFGAEVVRRLTARWPQAIIGLFGHIGDGNLHIVINVGKDTRQQHLPIDETIYGLVKELEGSVSAEHGIGVMKKPFLGHSRNPAEIALMQLLKNSLDPKRILNPGRIFD
ncbi:MAG: FAD-binding oxidoreductase [Pseudohongiellaceae bacterium]